MQGLSEVLLAITGELITSCELQLQSDPPDLDRLNVYIDGEVVPQQGDDGWGLDASESPPVLRLKGATCDHVASVGVENISIQYGCPTVILL